MVIADTSLCSPCKCPITPSPNRLRGLFRNKQFFPAFFHPPSLTLYLSEVTVGRGKYRRGGWRRRGVCWGWKEGGMLDWQDTKVMPAVRGRERKEKLIRVASTPIRRSAVDLETSTPIRALPTHPSTSTHHPLIPLHPQPPSPILGRWRCRVMMAVRQVVKRQQLNQDSSAHWVVLSCSSWKITSSSSNGLSQHSKHVQFHTELGGREDGAFLTSNSSWQKHGPTFLFIYLFIHYNFQTPFFMATAAVDGVQPSCKQVTWSWHLSRIYLQGHR